MPGPLQKVTGQLKDAADNRRRELPFPLILVLVGVFEKLDVALNHLGERHVAPAPELRRGRAGDARDGGRAAVMLDGHALSFVHGQRGFASRTVPLPREQRANGAGAGLLGLLKFFRDSLRQLRDIRAPERGD